MSPASIASRAGSSRRARARPARGLDGRFSYQQGEAQRLPFPDDSFDLTTCQTVLIHLPDPAAAIAEMLRVTRPGGLVAVAEPNNLTEALLLDSISNQASVDEIVELVRFQLTCERGKVALGEGDNSLGDRVPGLFVAQGLVDVEVHVNDKATAVFPPYAAAAQRAFTEDARDRAGSAPLELERGRRAALFLAGGGAEDDFAAHFARALASRERIVRGLDDAHLSRDRRRSVLPGRRPKEPRRGCEPQDCVTRLCPCISLASENDGNWSWTSSAYASTRRA